MLHLRNLLKKRVTHPVSQRRSPRTLTPSFETLESRRLLAITAVFSGPVLSVFGDNQDNTIDVSRDAAGKILVNGGAVAILGGTPTVANTTTIQVFGSGGDDTITLNEANGALPRANLFGGVGQRHADRRLGADLLFGQAGNDTLLGKGGFDFLFGGSEQRHADRRRRRRPGRSARAATTA